MSKILALPGFVWVAHKSLMTGTPPDRGQASRNEREGDAILGEIPTAPCVRFEELDRGVHALCGGVGERCFVVASNPGRGRLRVFAQAMMGGCRE